jgi:uncharacterized membrane protein
MPAARTNESAHFALSYYAQFGSSVGEIFKNLLFKPWLWIGDIIKNFGYVACFLLPTALLPLLAPAELALTIPTFAINLLSNEPTMQSIIYQYSSGINCFIFIAVVFGIVRLRDHVLPYIQDRFHLPRRLLGRWTVACCAACMVGSMVMGPIPGLDWYVGFRLTPGPISTALPQGAYLDALARQIPATASVSVTAVLEPHFSERQHIYQFPLEATSADYVIVQHNSGSEPTLYPPALIDAAAHTVLADPHYTRVYQSGQIEVFKHR